MSKHIIIGQSTNINVFSWLVFLQIEREREREWYTKFGYKGEMSPKLLIFRRGSTGEYFFFHGLIDFVLFFYTGLKNLGSFVSQLFFCLQPGVKWLWFVCPLRTLLKNSFSYYLFPLTGGAHFRFGVPANHLASLSLPFRCPATWGY